MKLKLASLVLAVFAPLSSYAAVSIATPGKIGTVTLNFVMSYEDGGFNGEYTKTITDTKTSYLKYYRSVIVKSKYSNNEFIKDLIARYDLSGKVSGYTIKFVTANNIGGYFIVSRDSKSITCIGSSTTSSNYGNTPINTYYGINSEEPPYYTEVGTTTGAVKGEAFVYTDRFSNTSEQCAAYLYFNPLNESYFETFGFITSSGSYTATRTTKLPTPSVVKVTIGSTNVTGIIGTNYDGTTLTGSMTVSPMSDVADVTAYVTAYNNYYD